MFLISDLLQFIYSIFEITIEYMKETSFIIYGFIFIILDYYFGNCINNILTNIIWILFRLSSYLYIDVLFEMKQIIKKFHQTVVRYSINEVEQYEY
jgi:hypothetical protein